MAWVWASGGSMLKDGQPDLDNEAVVGTLEYIKSLNDAGVISPGIFAKKEQDKVEEFVNGRVGMMVGSLAWVNLIRERNPDLNFGISAVPAADDYTGKRGMPYASWGIGISEGSENKEEAWKLVEYLMSPEVNSKLVTIANAFPGNVNAKPDFSKSDPLFAEAFKIYQEGYLANEFTGLPVAEELMRQMDVEVQKMFDGQADRAGSGRRHADAVGGGVRQVGAHAKPGSASRLPGAGPSARSRPDREESPHGPASSTDATGAKLRTRRRGLISHKAGTRLVPLLYVTPATLLFCLLCCSRWSWSSATRCWTARSRRRTPAFAGLQNYREVFADPVFWESVGNTLYFTVMSVIFHLLIGLAFALLLNSTAGQSGAPEHPAGALHPAVAVHRGDHRGHLAAAARPERRHQQRADDAAHRRLQGRVVLLAERPRCTR